MSASPSTGRARTTVDHIFRNPHDKQLEGTFEYPVPTGASPSYFAMFLGQTRDTLPPRFSPPKPFTKDSGVNPFRLKPEELVKHVEKDDWGKLQEARVVAKDKALETYEDVVRTKIDPALLEYAGGNTFSGRVFPIPAKGYNRVILAYEETLPVSQERMVYRFPLPDCKLKELEFVCWPRTSRRAKVAFFSHGPEGQLDRSELIYKRTWTEKGPGGDAVFAFKPERGGRSDHRRSAG